MPCSAHRLTAGANISSSPIYCYIERVLSPLRHFCLHVHVLKKEAADKHFIWCICIIMHMTDSV